MVRWLIALLVSIALLVALAITLSPRRAQIELAATPTDDARTADATLAISEELSTPSADGSAPGAERTTIERRAPSQHTVATPPRSGLPFRGRVVDVATGEPVGFALAVCGDLEAATDEDGRFASDATLPADFEEIAFHSLGKKSHIRSARRSELEWLGDEHGFLARIRIGPTYRFRVVGVPAEPEARWQLRVVEQRADGSAHAWGWVAAVSGDPSWARYDNPQPAPPARTQLHIEIEDERGSRRGSEPIATIVGIHPGVLTVALDPLGASVVGRVLDDAGKPRDKASVLAIPRDGTRSHEESWPAARTDGEGRYVLRALDPGPYWIEARPRRGEDPRVIALDVLPGENVAADIVVPAEEYAGAVEGLLTSSSETFAPAVVRLRAVDGRTFDHFDFVDPNRQARMEVGRRDGRILHDPRIAMEPRGSFEFQQVPAGEYELTVISSDGRRYSPSPLRVRPPKRDLEIVRDDAASTWQAAFDVRDAETGEPIDDAFAQFQLGGAWSPGTKPIVAGAALRTLVAGADLRWNVHAEGYALASGTERDFMGTGDVRVATVRLARGFGARLLLRDAAGQFTATNDDWVGRVAALERDPVAGVQVLADGEIAAASDADGVALLALARTPERIEIHAPGWIVLGSEHFRGGKIVGHTREAVVWLTRP